MKKSTFYPCLILFYLLLPTLILTAQTENKIGFYDRGSKAYSVVIEDINSIGSDNDIKVYTIRGGVGFYFRKNLAIYGHLDVTKVHGYRVDDSDIQHKKINAKTFGMGAAFLFQWYLIKIKSSSLYLDYGSGFIYTLDNFPPSGTMFNYIHRFGLGLSIRFKDNLQVIGGVRFLHISNGGKLFGHSKNPSYDGLGGFVGLTF